MPYPVECDPNILNDFRKVFYKLKYQGRKITIKELFNEAMTDLIKKYEKIEKKETKNAKK